MPGKKIIISDRRSSLHQSSCPVQPRKTWLKVKKQTPVLEIKDLGSICASFTNTTSTRHIVKTSPSRSESLMLKAQF